MCWVIDFLLLLNWQFTRDFKFSQECIAFTYLVTSARLGVLQSFSSQCSCYTLNFQPAFNSIDTGASFCAIVSIPIWVELWMGCGWGCSSLTSSCSLRQAWCTSTWIGTLSRRLSLLMVARPLPLISGRLLFQGVFFPSISMANLLFMSLQNSGPKWLSCLPTGAGECFLVFCAGSDVCDSYCSPSSCYYLNLGKSLDRGPPSPPSLIRADIILFPLPAICLCLDRAWVFTVPVPAADSFCSFDSGVWDVTWFLPVCQHFQGGFS